MGASNSKKDIEDRMMLLKLKRMEIQVEKEKELKKLSELEGSPIKQTIIPDYIDHEFAKKNNIYIDNIDKINIKNDKKKEKKILITDINEKRKKNSKDNKDKKKDKKNNSYIASIYKYKNSIIYKKTISYLIIIIKSLTQIILFTK